MTIKLNSLEDPKMIDLIREAIDRGVKVRMLIRGICCFLALNDKQEEIKIVSIVDDLLEHTRIYKFGEGENAEIYLASADWMTRNLSHRIEVAFPIIDEPARDLLNAELDLQLSDSIKGRIAHGDKINQMVEGDNKISSQQSFYELIQRTE